MKLSILIPYIKRHQHYFQSLAVELSRQAIPYSEEIEILFDNDENDKIGTKRNRLLERATGEYVAFFDADDKPSDDYVELLMEGIEQDVDCCSLKGVITSDGADPHYFEHSIKYKEYKTNHNASYDLHQIRYERYPNHISCIRSEYAKRFKFPEKSWGEDTDWATLLNESGLLKTEHYIDEVIYYYEYQSVK